MNTEHENESLFIGATFSCDLPKGHGKRLPNKIPFGTYNEHGKENHNHGLNNEENI
ncbi:hypothetical protein [Allomuricauda sp. SCSIO 65647]|uniref:hypothetical protein n=1 Tax=Allomuricauda sp. SCSIO 65647 TaxID=2908843 RepID=UPI001F43D15D|nr:hypothetical protein [Muricauda sp. SCSIO 65647]UJH69156.1 hypothetical protein L0P89_08055 [Muricauda sp. SCSIO 65647]